MSVPQGRLWNGRCGYSAGQVHGFVDDRMKPQRCHLKHRAPGDDIRPGQDITLKATPEDLK